MGGRSNYNPNLSGAASATGANGAMVNGRHWGPSSSRIGAGAGLSGSGLSRGSRSIIAIDDDEDEDEVRIEDRRSSSHNKHGRSHQVSSRPSSSASKHHRSSSRAQSISDDDDDDDDDDDVQADYDAHRDRHRHHSSRKSGSSSRADIPAPTSRRMIGRTILGADDDEDEEEIQEVRHTRDQASPSPPPVPSRKKSTLPQVDQSALQPFIIQRKEERVSRGLAEIRAKRQAQGQTTSSAAAAAAAASSPAKGTRANIVIPGRSSSFHPTSTGSSRPSIGANAGINRSSPSSRPLSKALPSEVGLLYDPKDIQRRSHVGDKDHIVIDDSDDDDAAAASARRPAMGGSARSRPISIDDDDDDANGGEDHGGDDEGSRHSHAATSARPRRQDDDNQQDDELFRFVMAEKRKAKKLAEQKEKDARLAAEKQAAEEAARARAEAEAEAAAAAAAAQASTAVNPALWASTAASRTFNFNDFLSSAPSSSIAAAATTSSNGNAIQSTSVAAAAVTDLSTVPGTFDFGQGAGSSADILHSFGALTSNGNAVGASGEPGISTAQDDAALLMAMFDSVTAGPTQNSAAAASSLGPDLAAASAGPPMSFDPVTGMASTDAVLSVPTAQPSEEANGHPDDPQQQGQGHGPSSGNGLFEQLDLATIGGAGGFSFGLEENEDGDDVLMTTELPDDDEEQIQVSSGASTAGPGSRQASPDLGAADDILDLLCVSAPPADEEMAEISSSRNDQADPGVHQNGEEDEPANRAGLTAKEASASASGSYVGSAAAAASADSQATSAIGHGQNPNETVPETLAPFPTADDDEESPPDRGATTTVPNYGLMLPTGGVAASGGDGESPIGDAEPGMDDSDDGEGDLEVHSVIEQADRSVAPEAQSHEPADITMATNGHDQDREERQGQSDLEVDYGEDAEYGEEEYEYDIEQEEEEEVFDPSKMTIALNPGFEGSSGAVKDMWDDSELLESWDAGMDEHEVFRAQLSAALAAAQRGASRAEQEQAAAEAMAELQSKLEAKAEEAARQSNALMSRKRKTASSGSSTWLESPLPGSKAAKLAAKEHAAQALRRAQQAAAASQAARARVEATLLQKREAEARKKALREQAAAKQRQQEEADRAAAEQEERERRAAEKARVKANGRRRNSESSDVMAVDSPAGTSIPTHADKTAAKTQGIASPSKPGVASRVPAKATPQVFAVAAPKVKPAVPVVPSGAEEEKQLEKEKELLALGVPAASISGGLIGAALRVTGLGRTAAQPVATSWAHSSQTVAKTPNRLPDSGAGEGADDAAEYQLKKDEVSLAKTIEAMTRAGTEAAVRAYKLDLPNLRDAKEVEAETAATASTSGSGVSGAISKQLAELDQVRVDAVQKLMQAWYWVGHYSKGLNVLNEQSEALKAQASQPASSSSLAGPSQAGPSSKP